MVNRNTKHTRKKKLSKKKQQELAQKLESSVANISKKGIFFKSRNKNGSYSIVDGTKKEVLIENILLPESANIIIQTLKSANKQKITRIVENFESTLRRYQPNIEKHLNDIFFYRHTMKTTKDSIKFFSTEARIDMSVSKLRYERDCLQDKLGINVLHATHLD
tara:strand:- start:112927 stop:113415 length:489 start_codon:yes stop_codon:yes gene_type:complete